MFFFSIMFFLQFSNAILDLAMFIQVFSECLGAVLGSNNRFRPVLFVRCPSACFIVVLQCFNCCKALWSVEALLNCGMPIKLKSNFCYIAFFSLSP